MSLLARSWLRPLAVALACLAHFSLASPDIVNELGPSLSNGAKIVLPGSVAFKNATDRDNEQDPPTFAVIVEVATEQDVQETVRYANCHNIPFLATTGLHGNTQTLGNIKQGINIYLRQMKSATIAKDGNSATFGGGILSVEARDAVQAAGKQTVTGACECTSLAGPLLGGGYGYLQGFYGLMADNLISARVVLATGDVITVSATEHPDLFWALKGAGHNFGIVTSITSRIYDIPSTKWSYAKYIYTHDKIEAVFTQLNAFTDNGNKLTPVQFTNKNAFARIPPIDANNAVLVMNIFYQGADVVPTEYTAPLLAIGPAVPAANSTDYLGLWALDGTRLNDTVCSQHDAVNMMFPIGLKSYSIPGQRAAFDAFNAFTADETFSNTAMVMEGYSSQAVKAVPSDSTAFPHRADNIVIFPVVSYAVNASLDSKAIAFGENLRQILYKSSGSPELHTYVNYAHGDETLQELYGYEPWRIAQLRVLKQIYDPTNKFGFYSPI